VAAGLIPVLTAEFALAICSALESELTFGVTPEVSLELTSKFTLGLISGIAPVSTSDVALALRLDVTSLSACLLTPLLAV
jgi:hypothetical protein